MNPAALQESAEAVKSVLAWLNRYRSTIDCRVERIPFADSRQWHFDSDHSSLSHRSGKFFTIRGYRAVRGDRPTLFQPLIDQPEIGTQGFIIRRREHQLDVLVQARTEPGNIGLVQIGPTIQATFSNYTAVHGGKQPLFLQHFHQPAEHGAHVLVDTTQPELGTKFLKKWNRNMVIEIPQMEFQHPMFRWLPLRSLTSMMKQDHVVNNDARLVVGLLLLACGASLYESSDSPVAQAVAQSFRQTTSSQFRTGNEIQSWLANLRDSSPQEVEALPLPKLPDWEMSEDEIRHRDNRHFSVIQVRVHAADREVIDWDQPLVASSYRNRVQLLCAVKEGVLQFLMRAEDQIGNADGPQLQPTFCDDNSDMHELPTSIQRLVRDSDTLELFQSEASDEGGRFFQCISRYEVRWIHGRDYDRIPPAYCWLTLGQISELTQQTHCVSDESRSILSIFLASVYSQG